MNDTLRRQLFLYVEAKRGKPDAMSQSERDAFEAQINESTELREEMERIETAYLTLSRVPAPQPTNELAAKCLDVARRAPSRWVFHAARAGVFTVIALIAFGAGMWFQPGVEPKQPFPLLLEKQVELITALEASIDEKYHLASGSPTPWSAPIDKLKHATMQMAAMYDQRPNDLVVKRGLSIVVANNIAVLQSLNEYIQSSDEIPDFDFTAIQTAPQGAI